jgi:hypothetical protein
MGAPLAPPTHDVGIAGAAATLAAAVRPAAGAHISKAGSPWRP